MSREKYFAFREVISRYAQVPELETPEPPQGEAVEIAVEQGVPLLGVLGLLGEAEERESLPAMDELGFYRGFAFFEAMTAASGSCVLTVGELRDRALVMVDGTPAGVLNRRTLTLVLRPGARLQILLEDQGRVNYGPRLGEHKGLLGGVRLNGAPLEGWQIRGLALDELPEGVRAKLFARARPAGGKQPLPGPAFYSCDFTAAEGVDLFLELDGWTKGMAYVNGFNLGRYWSGGRQRTIYIPGPLLCHGFNSLVLFEFHGATSSMVRFRPTADLGHTEA